MLLDLQTLQTFKDKPCFIYHGKNNQIINTFEQFCCKVTILVEHFKTLTSAKCVGIFMKNNFFIPICVYSLIHSKTPFILLDVRNSIENNVEIIKDLCIDLIICNNKREGQNIINDKSSSWKLREFNVDCDILFVYHRTNKDVEFEKNVLIRNDVCYCIQTSGTLGKKKYVHVTTECIASNLKCLSKNFNVTINDVIYFGTPFTFDPCIIELLLSLTTGATLLATSNAIRNNPNKLFAILFNYPNRTMQSDNGISILQMCPSVFLRWTDVQIEFVLNRSNLRVLALGGEPFPNQINKYARSVGLKVFNLYGITEVSCWASMLEVVTDDVDGDISLGEVLDDTEFEVRDDDGNAVRSGEGILYIGSSTRLCYVDNEATTTTKVYRNTGDIVRIERDAYYYVGRANQVIKRYGYRICLNHLTGIVENALGLQCKCIWLDDLHKIVMFIRIADYNTSHKEKIIDKIRVELLKHIESSKFPDLIDLVHDLPLTHNGKTNFDALKVLAREKLLQPGEILDVSEAFKMLWCKYLRLTNEEGEEKSHRSFVELGGSSIQFTQLINELELITRIKVDMIQIVYDSSYNDAVRYLRSIGGGNKVARECNASNTSSKVLKIAWKYDLQACVDTKATISKCGKYIGIGNFSHNFYVLTVNGGALIAQRTFTQPIESSCCFANDSQHVYVGCFDGCVYCLAVEDCRIVWTFKTGDRVKNEPCLCLQDEAVAFGSYDGWFYCLKCNDATVLWKYRTNEGITATPLNCNQTICLAGIKGGIYCLSEHDGAVRWKSRTKHPIFASPQSGQNDSVIICLDLSGTFYCFDPYDGVLRWTYQITADSAVYSKYTIRDDLVIFGKHETLMVLKYDRTQCQEVYTTAMINHQIMAQPILHLKHFVIFPSTDGFIFVYQLDDDNKLIFVDYLALNGTCFACPTISDDGKLFIGCRDNYIYCVELIM